MAPALKVEMVVYRLEGHPSNIKENIVTRIGDELEDNVAFVKSHL